MRPEYITGFHDTAAATAALSFTRRLADATGATVVAAYVYPDVRPVPSPYGPEELITRNADLTAVARAAAEAVVATVPDDVEALLVAGASVPHELDRLARGEHAALLAVGASHRGAIGRLLPGSIAERVVHGSPCPVLVVPEGDGERTVGSIAVAYDGGQQSRRALRAATMLAERLDAALVLIGVTEPDHDVGDVLTARMRTTLEQAATQVRQERGLRASIRLPIAKPGPGIAGACADDIDLLVAGTRAHRPIRSALEHSVARYLVDHAPCPVLVVPRHATIALVGDAAAVTVGSD
jgi:nucleotide-binding universal stress UspA family protein